MRKVNKAFVDVHSCPTLCNPIDTRLPSFTISQNLLKLLSIELVMPSKHLILCHPPFLLPSIFPSIRVFSNESALCIRCPSCWSFSFSISPSSEYSDTQNYSLLLARILLWNSGPSLVASKNGWAGSMKGQTSVQISVLLGNIWQQTFQSLFWSLIPVGREVLPKLEISALWKMRHNWDTEERTGKRKAQSSVPCSWLLVSNAAKGKRSGTKTKLQWNLCVPGEETVSLRLVSVFFKDASIHTTL